ncbi:hypothetical protein SSBR45G_62950 [Bradyrhizobium sp. SSBR45G]|uniref:hypothetical protein n=1 Tax=unclassified Bradyrhizobium TaxID=2631580 RepID=UPI0023429F98|nr:MULTISPECIES: hypothetical protein [unclassified Bradyrhizobium]GLH81386.1 hypothetical protein SSBR45G_62950 [Bradyrhizobium sp. SSBR45G]GLH85906.1 hypothetical protein SSBR45R_33660 [Bradyrhizobium sp. SSBR45R]
MTTDVEHERAPIRASEALEWLRFPSAQVVNNRQTERWLAALIWLSMPFMLHLLRTAPGGWGTLLNSPEYFIYAVIDVIITLLLLYLSVLLLSSLLVHGESVETQAASRRTAVRIWMDAIVSCFGLTAILLSVSTWIAKQFSNHGTTDAIGLLLNREVGPWSWVIQYGYALAAALALSAVIRWRSQRRSAAWSDVDAALPEPNLLLVALFAYGLLKWAIYVTLYPFAYFTIGN